MIVYILSKSNYLIENNNPCFSLDVNGLCTYSELESTNRYYPREKVLHYDGIQSDRKEFYKWFFKEYEEIYDSNGEFLPFSWIAEIIKEGKLCPKEIRLITKNNKIIPCKPYPSLGFRLDDWESPTLLGQFGKRFHPKGEYEMRSKPTRYFHSSNQCIYDCNGSLIFDYQTNNVTVGTADRFATTWWLYLKIAHLFNDLDPFILAERLDGNKINRLWGHIYFHGMFSQMYYDVRPSLVLDNPKVMSFIRRYGGGRSVTY